MFIEKLLLLKCRLNSRKNDFIGRRNNHGRITKEDLIYMMRSLNGTYVYSWENKNLAELLLSKANAKLSRTLNWKYNERKETDHRRTSN